jgi:hypothetical protein
MQSGAPLIHFQMADVVSLQPDLPAEAITVVTNPAALPSAIESLLFDEQFHNAALRRQRDFAANDFRPDYPGDPVRTVVQKLIEKRRSPWRRRHKLAEKIGPDMSSKPPVDVSSLPTLPFIGAGYVDDILYAPNGRCRADGWAADLGTNHPAKAVHIFVNERWIAKGAPALERPDVAAVHNNPNFLATGFSIGFHVEHTELIDALRVYAEMQDGTFHLLARSFDDQISS